MQPGYHKGKDITFVDVGKTISYFNEKKIDREEVEQVIDNACAPGGACPLMGTANTMCLISEAMGMSLPGNGSASANGGALREMAAQAGRRVVEMHAEEITPRQIITRQSVENGIRACMAVGGSTNSIIHVPAIAAEAGIEESISLFDKSSKDTPLLVGITPNGPHTMRDLDRAGGLSAVLKTLGDKIQKGCLTVNGKTIGENIANAKVVDASVIHSLAKPLSNQGAIGILYGNLAREGAAVKQSAVPGVRQIYRRRRERTNDNLGLALAGRGQMNAAIIHYEKALAIKPAPRAGPQQVLAWLWPAGTDRRGHTRVPEGMELKPDYAEAHNNLGLALAAPRADGGGHRPFSNSPGVKPDYLDARQNLEHARSQR